MIVFRVAVGRVPARFPAGLAFSAYLCDKIRIRTSTTIVVAPSVCDLLELRSELLP
jgi:hypothetical protein